jgi:hypothetical protein
MADNLLFEILRRLVVLPSREEQLMTLAAAWLTISKEELADGWTDGTFQEVQTRQFRILDRMRDLISGEPDLELLRHKAEADRAIEESDWPEFERLQNELKRRLQEGE